MTYRQIARLHRQRTTQVEHEGTIFGLKMAALGFVTGFMLNPWIFPWF